MSKFAARHWFEVMQVRVERVQDISEGDAKAEGVRGIPRSRELFPTDDYRYPFHELWDSINKKRGYSFESNPFVWIYDYEKSEVKK